MKNQANNYAFIDSQNLYLSIQEQGWLLDCGRFRVYLKYKYGIIKAFLFLGYLDKAVMVTGDGDFHCLIKYLKSQNKFKKLLIPNRH